MLGTKPAPAFGLGSMVLNLPQPSVGELEFFAERHLLYHQIARLSGEKALSIHGIRDVSAEVCLNAH